MVTQHDHFGGDAEGNFVGGLRAEVQADGRMHLFKPFARDAFFEQVAKDVFDFAWTADHAYVASARFQRGAQGVFVKVMAACHNHDPARLVRLKLAYGLGDIAKGQLHLLAEDVRVGQVTPVVDDHNTEIQVDCQSCQGLSHVTCAGDYQARLRMQRFDKDLERCAATAYRLIGVQVDMNQLGLTIAQGLHSSLSYLRIDFRPGKTPARAAVSAREHLGSDSAGRRANSLDDGGHCHALSALEGSLNFVING